MSEQLQLGLDGPPPARQVMPVAGAGPQGRVNRPAAHARATSVDVAIVPAERLIPPAAAKPIAPPVADTAAVIRELKTRLTNPADLAAAIAALVASDMQATAAVAPVTDRTFKQVKFRRRDGVNSNVSMPMTFYWAVVEQAGNEKKARRLIRDMAIEAPDDVKNRAGWIQDKLVKAMSTARS